MPLRQLVQVVAELVDGSAAAIALAGGGSGNSISWEGRLLARVLSAINTDRAHRCLVGTSYMVTLTRFLVSKRDIANLLEMTLEVCVYVWLCVCIWICVYLSEWLSVCM